MPPSPRPPRRVALFVCLAALLFLAAAPVRAAERLTEETCLKETVRQTVHAAALGLAGLFQDMPGHDERVRTARAFTDRSRFLPDDAGYFFIYDLSCQNIALPLPKDMEGRNLADVKDKAGAYPIRELAARARQGAGFVEYYWDKLDSPGAHRKISYVEMIPGTGWFIGAGFYPPEER